MSYRYPDKLNTVAGDYPPTTLTNRPDLRGQVPQWNAISPVEYIDRLSTTVSVPKLKVTPGDTNVFYITASDATGGKPIIHRVGHNNLGDLSTPAVSMGAPFEPYRHMGTKELATYSGTWSFGQYSYADDTGAEDYALKVGTNYGGSYHGGETKVTETITQGGVTIDPLVGAEGTSAIVVQHTSVIDWGSGNTAAITSSVTYNLDGSVVDSFQIVSTASATDLFLGMGIASGANFNEATYTDSGSVVRAIPVVDGTTFLGTFTDVTVRDPTTGRWQRANSAASSQGNYRRTKLVRSTSLGRTKIYYEFNTGVIGTKTSGSRTRTYGLGSIGATAFTNLLTNGDFSSGLTGWTTTHNAAGISVVSGAMRFTRSSGSDTRANAAVTCIIGKTYLVTAKLFNDASSIYAALNLVVALVNTGSVTGAVVNQTWQGSESLGVLFTATQTTHYIMAYLQAGTAGQTIDLDDFQVIQVD